MYAIINPTIVDDRALKVACSSGVSKNWPLGHGSFSISSNIGSLTPCVMEAKEQGYDDVLWLLDDYILELSSKNIYIYW